MQNTFGNILKWHQSQERFRLRMETFVIEYEQFVDITDQLLIRTSYEWVYILTSEMFVSKL